MGLPSNTDDRRILGVVEAITAIRDQCPSGAVREYARMALEKVKDGGAPALREWAEYLLTTIQGWRGERADQVRESLRHFLSE